MQYQTNYNFLISFYQHPFVATATDKKPLYELIIEYKAEVFEEVTEELDEESVSIKNFFFKLFFNEIKDIYSKKCK